jgi:hypothetical protein
MVYHKKYNKHTNRTVFRRFSIRGKQRIKTSRFFCSVVLAVLILFCGSVCTETAIAGSGYSSTISLHGSNESWTQKWLIEDSALKSPEGLKAGFHKRLPRNLNLKLAGVRRGIVCIFPESRYRPARMKTRNLKITNENIVLVTKVAATRYPRGRWEFMLKLNDIPFTDPIIINGNDGWQDMEFDLSSYLGVTVEIQIEAKMIGNGRNSSVFIDYIGFMGLDGKKKSDSILTPDSHTDSKKPFDDEYETFLEILRRNEEIRHYRIMDRNFIESYYNQSHRKIKK